MHLFNRQFCNRQKFRSPCHAAADQIILWRLVNIFQKKFVQIPSAYSDIISDVSHTDRFQIIILDIFYSLSHINIVRILVISRQTLYFKTAG